MKKKTTKVSGPILVTLAGGKGGVGKSTIGRALALEGTKNGLQTKLADLDVSQGSSLDWSRRRLEAGLDAVSTEAFRTLAQLMAKIDNFDLIVADCPGHSSAETLAICKVSRLVCLPASPSLDDLLPGVRTANELVKGGIPRARIVFALTRTGTLAEEADARAYIEEAGYAVLPVSLPERSAYRLAQASGRSISETPFKSLNTRANQFIQALIDSMESQRA